MSNTKSSRMWVLPQFRLTVWRSVYIFVRGTPLKRVELSLSWRHVDTSSKLVQQAYLCGWLNQCNVAACNSQCQEWLDTAVSMDVAAVHNNGLWGTNEMCRWNKHVQESDSNSIDYNRGMHASTTTTTTHTHSQNITFHSLSIIYIYSTAQHFPHKCNAQNSNQLPHHANKCIPFNITFVKTLTPPNISSTSSIKTQRKTPSKAHLGFSSWCSQLCRGPQQHRRHRWSGRGF